MPEWMEMTDEIGPEKIVHVHDPVVGMKGVVVIDSTAMARTAGGGIRMLPDITTKEIAGLARGFWRLSSEVVRDLCMRMADKNYGKSELLNHYHDRHSGWNPQAGLPLAEDLTKVDQYATAAWWAKAEFLEALKQYAKAISAYRNCQNEPTNLWRIAHCHDKLSKLDAAVAQTREIENFFPSDASRAAMHIAQLYKRANEKKKYISALRDVLKKYPDSGQSRQAHIELEQEGFKMGGGIDAG